MPRSVSCLYDVATKRKSPWCSVYNMQLFLACTQLRIKVIDGDFVYAAVCNSYMFSNGVYSSDVCNNAMNTKVRNSAVHIGNVCDAAV